MFFNHLVCTLQYEKPGGGLSAPISSAVCMSTIARLRCSLRLSEVHFPVVALGLPRVDRGRCGVAQALYSPFVSGTRFRARVAAAVLVHVFRVTCRGHTARARASKGQGCVVWRIKVSRTRSTQENDRTEARHYATTTLRSGSRGKSRHPFPHISNSTNSYDRLHLIRRAQHRNTTRYNVQRLTTSMSPL
jgi:hypothetical protein